MGGGAIRVILLRVDSHDNYEKYFLTYLKDWREKMIYFKQVIPFLCAHRKFAIDLVWVKMEENNFFVKEREHQKQNNKTIFGL